jgi:predicted permease
MAGVLQDLRMGVRTLGRAPGFTAVAVLSLALGIGANATVFSLVNAVLLRPLPVAQPDALVRVGLTRNGEGFFPFSYPEYLEIRDGAADFLGVIGHHPNNAILDTDGEAAETMIEIVSGNYFDVLGVRPTLGRAFVAQEDRTPGTHPVMVISHALWRSRFGGDPGVLGSPVRLNGREFTVVGVAPPEFRGTFTGLRIDLWVPVMMQEAALPDEPRIAQHDYRFLMLLGRLRPGVHREDAADRLASVASGLEGEGAGISLAPAGGVHPLLGGFVRGFLLLLMAIVGLVLLIACANVANLTLARGTARRREIGVRLALGAGRGRVVRQLLVESLLLAGAGALAGLAVAWWAARWFAALRPPVGVPIGLDTGIDGRVLATTAAVAVMAAVAFGLVPALRSSDLDLSTSMREGERRGAWPGSLGRNGLVVVQVAVSALLLVGAALLIQTLIRSRSADPGFDPRNVLVASLEPGRLGYPEQRVRALWRDVREDIERLPGVRGTSLALFAPLGDRADQLPVTRAEDPPPAEGAATQRSFLAYNYVSPGYFQTMGIALLEGRDFALTDGPEAMGVAIVNQALAGRFWPGGSALGRQVRVSDREGRHRNLEVVAVARDIKYRTLAEGPRPFLYLPFAQWYRPDMLIHVRTAAGAPALIHAVRDAVRRADPTLAPTVTTLEDEMAFSLVPARVAGAVLTGAGSIGLLLATIGIFGVVSYSVERRGREIGIRMAVGARATQVRRMVVAQALKLAAAGAAVGLGLAVGAARLLRGLLVGVGPNDPATFATIALLFLAVAAAASYLPARRASRADPAAVLRSE